MKIAKQILEGRALTPDEALDLLVNPSYDTMDLVHEA